MKVVIVLPTLNERDNIGPLIDQLPRLFEEARDQELHILVVDDDSSDGTRDVVGKKVEVGDNVHMMDGPRLGLGAALVAGMRRAMTALGADVVVTMDADFSHRPVDVLRLVAALREGTAEVAVGSRYVEGASLPDEWGWYRRLNSDVANFFARRVAGLGSINDCTSGLRAIRVKDGLDRIALEEIDTKGYAFQMIVLGRLVKAGCRVVEVPITFEERRAGKSKVGFNRRYLRDVLEFLTGAVTARLHRGSVRGA